VARPAERGGVSSDIEGGREQRHRATARERLNLRADSTPTQEGLPEGLQPKRDCWSVSARCLGSRIVATRGRVCCSMSAVACLLEHVCWSMSAGACVLEHVFGRCHIMATKPDAAMVPTGACFRRMPRYKHAASRPRTRSTGLVDATRVAASQAVVASTCVQAGLVSKKVLRMCSSIELLRRGVDE